ncbi:unnamed protein product [Protopolystoma xenopodis]|uniref:AMP-dependent synthetase/ligase domain-containing protein n=1 Tax=Protopolystoma xenopodis TaxID=117903 RepID=A0A3S5CJN4_9PLAT|nr:unnamed protein product [Protopolystoma xenopodis]
MCRYLLAQPLRPTDNAHKVWLAFGNGLRPQVWTEFCKRFGIKRIGEFYGATESNANFCNADNKVGAIGFTSRILPWAYPVTLIQIDQTDPDAPPLRDPRTGLCMVCPPDVPGQLVGRITEFRRNQLNPTVSKTRTTLSLATSSKSGAIGDHKGGNSVVPGVPLVRNRTPGMTGLSSIGSSGDSSSEMPSSLVSRLTDRVMPNLLRAYDGYVSQKASQKKIIRDVFRKGDAYFLSGSP